MYSIVSTASIHGVLSMIVQVEADVCSGLPAFEMVGFLSSQVREAKERIRAAIRNAGVLLPPKRITINLCPADVKKNGTGFDLPIALAVLSAYGIVPHQRLKETLFVGEITLNGELRPVKGMLPMALEAQKAGFTKAVVPKENAWEAGFAQNLKVYPVSALSEVIGFLKGEILTENPPINIEKTQSMAATAVDFSQINGQYMLRRACEVAAAGMHNILMTGPPGTGKTLAANAMASILPPLMEEEMMELAGIYSVSGLFAERREQLYQRPFRSPHDSVTRSALLGGGRVPKPGEISLAHKGILFLDELTEYEKPLLEQLRQPLEERYIRLVRQTGTYCYPADFILVAAMNPCGCGYYPNREKCTCTPGQIRQHLAKVSRPLLDRMDLTVEAPKVKIEELVQKKENESSQDIRERVQRAHEIQKRRFQKESCNYNGRMEPGQLRRFCPMDPGAKGQLTQAYEALDLSARAYHRLVRVARTIADLEGSEEIKEHHMEEALLYRNMDGTSWRMRL